MCMYVYINLSCLNIFNNKNTKTFFSKKGDMVRKLDIHCHILPRDIPDWKQQFGYGGFIYLARDELKPGWVYSYINILYKYMDLYIYNLYSGNNGKNIQ